MNDQVIDCCSLINLYTGLKGLAPLSDLDVAWYVCEAVVAESEYTREFDEAAGTTLVPIELGPAIDAEILRPVRPESEQELSDYVDFATEVDDGEAQALAIAKNRGFALLTDDRKAAALAAEVGVNTVSTANVLRAWGDLSLVNKEKLPEIVRRITTLARFVPPADSPDYEWWRNLLDTPPDSAD